MLSKFISVEETRLQNTETTLKNQQASIQGLETQIGQLSKLISERPQADDAVTLQVRDSVKTTKTQDNAINPVNDKTNIQSSLQEPPRTKTIETVHYYHVENKDANEERRLRIEELDEWRVHKPRTHDKPKLRQNEFNTSPNQLKVGDKVLLEATDPHIVTTTLNEEIPLTVLSIFPFSTVEVSHPKFGTFKHTRPGTRACLKPWPNKGRDTALRYGRVEAGHDFPKTRGAINPHGRATWTYIMSSSRGKKATVPSSKRRRGQGSSSVRATAEVRHSFLEFSQASQEELFQILRAQPITTGHCIDWAAVEHFGLLNTAVQSSVLTLIGQMSSQGITTMLHMRMIERRRGTDPPQYRLSHAIDEEDLEDIPDDVPPQHEEPFTVPPREQQGVSPPFLL
ncbi:hypothetical protein GOBAR_AA14572 [Gossypium barbadense]|uniref:Uncharacterized protein n=1 Tax=Gossypium barbadense TaxID=3634 RepID=A0A2P5XRX2_GOSBA|nr:hypothetical protein GOBAR_AA14572 [Gossypium barbadense]